MNCQETVQRFKLIVFLFLLFSCTKDPVSPVPLPDDPVTDIDGNIYQTVRIGNQVWMAENLRTTRYNDGTPVTLDTSKTTWTNARTEKYCYYNNTTNTDSVKKLGALYNWYVVNSNKLAPTGWHVPTAAEWDILQNHMISNGYNYDGTTTGNKIGKSLAAKEDWVISTNTGAIGNNLSTNNISGFSAYPSGSRLSDGPYVSIGECGYFWSATESSIQYYAYYRYLDYSNGYLLSGNFLKFNGFSVRCVRD
jgi:uncharacterized protein (TIGR02145 family)